MEFGVFLVFMCRYVGVVGGIWGVLSAVFMVDYSSNSRLIYIIAVNVFSVGAI